MAMCHFGLVGNGVHGPNYFRTTRLAIATTKAHVEPILFGRIGTAWLWHPNGFPGVAFRFFGLTVVRQWVCI